MISETPRVRFAPSPTGYLHVGGLRTALYNYLFARKNNGAFILRIEDTDRNRYVEGAVENLIAALAWAGLEYDEGPVKGGEFGPYMQSERLKIYKKYVDELIEKKKAYYCFCSAERLVEVRESQQKMGMQPKYDKHCLRYGEQEIKQKLEAGLPYVIRMKVEPALRVVFDDIVRGRVEFNSSVIDDQVLLKSDGFPTYHLANVVDDHLMQITHVIRGEEWLSSVPKHVLLYEFFGWEKPIFAHLPLLLNPDKSKLSKRQGDVAVEDYRAKGYLKEALVNFVSLLGWSAGDNKEFYTLEELRQQFSLERVNKSGAVFNLEKLNWLNQEHLRAKPNTALLLELKSELALSRFKEAVPCDEYLLGVIEILKERVTFVKEYITVGSYFFENPAEYDEKAKAKAWDETAATRMTLLADKYAGAETDTKEMYETLLREAAAELNVPAGKMIHPARLAVTGFGVGPGLFELFAAIGKEYVVERIRTAVKMLG